MAKPAQPAKTGERARQKIAAATAVSSRVTDEMEELAQAELAAEEALYTTHTKAEEEAPQNPVVPADTHDNPFEEPAPTPTDKHNTSVKNALRAKRVAAARNGRLAASGDVLTKSRPA